MIMMPYGWPWSSLQLTSQADFWHPTGAGAGLRHGRGAVRPATVDLQAASVTRDLPPALVDAPAGLYLPGTGNTTPGENSGPSAGTLIPPGILDSGQTITMHVGDVLAPPPLFPGEDPGTASRRAPATRPCSARSAPRRKGRSPSSARGSRARRR